MGAAAPTVPFEFAASVRSFSTKHPWSAVVARKVLLVVRVTTDYSIGHRELRHSVGPMLNFFEVSAQSWNCYRTASVSASEAMWLIRRWVGAETHYRSRP